MQDVTLGISPQGERAHGEEDQSYQGDAREARRTNLKTPNSAPMGNIIHQDLFING